MANYSYRYACGHGTGTVKLYGKNSERERKLAQLEATELCPECRAKTPAEKKALIKYGNGNVPLFSVVLYGNTFENKEKIKAKGFAYDYDDWESEHYQDRPGLRNVMPPKSQQKAWQKTFEAHSENEYRQKVAQIIAEAAELGYELKGSVEYPIELKRFAGQWAKIAETKAKAEADKPKYNGCFEFLAERHGDDYNKRERAGGKPWNGKIYGRKGGYNYYIDDKRYSMTDEQAAAIREYQEAIKAWREKHR